MKRFIPLLFIVGITALPLSAEVLFVKSVPITSEVLLDGTPVGSTPLILHDIEPGPHNISVIQPGYVLLEEEILVTEGAPTIADFGLQPNTFVTGFAAPLTTVDGVSFPRGEATFYLQSGQYQLAGDLDGLDLQVVYPYDDLITALSIAWPVSLALSTAALLEDVWLRDKTVATPTPATIASFTLGGAELFTWLALLRDRKQYLAERSVEHFRQPLTETDAQRIFEDAEAALASGSLTQALSGYSRIVAASGQSQYTPASLYKASRIYVALGDHQLALAGFQMIITRYPDPEFYDDSLKSAADIFRAAQQYRKAIQTLEQMVFASSVFSPNEIRQLIREIDEERRNPPAEPEPGSDSEESTAEPAITEPAEATGGDQ